MENAARNGDLETVKLLHSRGADIHSKDDSALRKASYNGHLEVVKYLVENGADIHAFNDDAIKQASMTGHLNVVRYLTEKEADIHNDIDIAFRYASNNGHLDVVRYLIEHGANIHAENDYALKWASKNGEVEVVKYLLEKGANWKVLTNDKIAKLLKEETNELSKTLKNSYLSINQNIPTVNIDGSKSLIPKSLLLKMVYEAPYSELCSKINSELPPLKLLALANLMKLDYDIDISWLNLCNNIKRALYLML